MKKKAGNGKILVSNKYLLQPQETIQVVKRKESLEQNVKNLKPNLKNPPSWKRIIEKKKRREKQISVKGGRKEEEEKMRKALNEFEGKKYFVVVVEW